MQIEQKILKNKLNTLFINSEGSTTSSVQIWFRAGSALEKEADQGIAHFLEHMFFKGTAKRPGALIAKEVESFGGEINAFTSFDYTCYYINAPVTHLKNTIEIIMDMVSNPLFADSDFPAEREVVFEEFRRSLDNPSQFAFKELQSSCFTGGYGHQILGKEKTIKNFSKKQLMNFRKSFYTLQNSMLVVAGDLKDKKVLEKTIERYKMPSGKKSQFGKFKMAPKVTLNIHNKEVRQGVLTLCLESNDYNHERTPAEDLAINCLAHGESSRFYTDLVHETSLCSTVSGSTMYFNHGGSHFLRFVFPEKNIGEIVKTTLGLIEKVKLEGFSAQEVNRIKNQYVASKVYEKESLEAFAFSMGHGFAQTGNIHCEDQFVERIKATKTDEVNNAIKEIFSRHAHISLQIPKEEKKDQYKVHLQTLAKELKVIPKPKFKENKSERSKFDPMVKVLELKKGIKLIYRFNNMTPTFVMHAYLKGGVAHEVESNNGAFNLLTQMVTMGFNGLDYDVIKNTLENRSASLNGFAGKNAYGLTTHGQTEHVEELFEYFYGALMNPDFPEKFLKHEKEILYRILENQKEDPVKHCFKALNKIVFKNHPYALEHLGPKENIEHFSGEFLSRLHQKHLNEKEMVITYCGDLSLQKVIDLVSHFTDRLPKRELEEKMSRPVDGEFGQKLHIEFDREQTQIMLGRPSYKLGLKEDLMIKMLTTHLSGQGSDLFVEVRDRQGLCYSVQPVQMSALEAGYWGIFMASGFDKTGRAIEAIYKILNDLKVNGLELEEFETIKKVIEGQALVNIQTNEDYANVYSVPVLQGLGLDFTKNKQLEAKKLKLKEFNEFLKDFLNCEFNQITVGRKWE
ncbi:MAG: M16 family metallopeptidase [Bacteriovoracaceae bacterium]